MPDLQGILDLEGHAMSLDRHLGYHLGRLGLGPQAPVVVVAGSYS